MQAVVLTLTGLAAGHAAAGTKILVLGDSISAAYGIQREAGWVALLDARLSELGGGWQVVNASVSGETTGGGLARLPQALAAHDPDVVIVELGGNDGLRGYPVSRIRANLRELVSLPKSQGRDVLLVGMRIPPNYGPRYANAFADMYDELARELGVPLVPFILQDVALEPELMQSDGIHPTVDAQPRLLETIWPTLRRLLDS